MLNEKTVWVAYKQNEGFISRCSGPTNDFQDARTFAKKGHLSCSVGKYNIESGDIIPVPIKMVIDPEVMVILKLGGNPIFEL